MILFSLFLLFYPGVMIKNTLQTLEDSYNNRKFNECYGLEYFEDIDDIDEMYHDYIKQSHKTKFK